MSARWDRETNARLIELWEQGLSIDGISERIDRTPSAVQSRASKLRLRRQPGDRSRYAPVTADGKVYWTVTDDNQLRAQMASGLDVADIARSLGKTVSSVHTRWKRMSQARSPRLEISDTAMTRACMCCRTPFRSAWKGNRLCLPWGSYATERGGNTINSRTRITRAIVESLDFERTWIKLKSKSRRYFKTPLNHCF